jgi:hypothetical protein
MNKNFSIVIIALYNRTSPQKGPSFRLIQQHRFADCLEWLEIKGFTGEATLFILRWMGGAK